MLEIVNKAKWKFSFERGNIAACVIILAVFFAFVFSPAVVFAKSKTSTKKTKLAEPVLSSDSYIVMSISTGESIYSKNQDRKQFISGPDRLMCVLCVLGNMHDRKELKNYVQITDDVARRGEIFESGQSVTVNDLMYAVIISGSKEAELALAIYSSGSEEAFVESMNNKAKELKMKNTAFANATGDYDNSQYCSAEDYAILTKTAMQNDDIKEMAIKKGYKIKTEDGKSVIVKNAKELVDDAGKSNKNGYSIFCGIASENSNDEKYSYMVSGINKDMKLVAIAINVSKEDMSKNVGSLLAYGFSKVRGTVAVEKNKKIGYVWIRRGEKTLVPVYTAEKAFVYIPPEGSKSLVETRKVIFKDVKAPLREGAKVGEYKIYVGDEFQGSVDLIVKKSIITGWPPSNIYISNLAVIASGTILLLLIMIRIDAARRRRLREKKKRMARKAKAKKMAARQLAREEDRKKRNWYY